VSLEGSGFLYKILFLKNFKIKCFIILKSRVATYAKNAKEEQQIFWQKNQKLNRPISPHLTIYRY